MWFKMTIYIVSSFFILASILAMMGFDKVFRDKPWPSDFGSNISIILIAAFFIILIQKISSK